MAGRAAAGAAVGAAAGRDAGEAVDGASSGVGAEANLDSRCVGDPRLGPPVAVCLRCPKLALDDNRRCSRG